MACPHAAGRTSHHRRVGNRSSSPAVASRNPGRLTSIVLRVAQLPQPLLRRVQSLSGPVLTLVVWQFLNLVNVAALGPMFDRDLSTIDWWFVGGLAEAVVVLGIVCWGDHITLAIIKALVAFDVAGVLWAIAGTPSPVGMLTTALSLLVPVLYVAYWFPRWVDVLIVVAGSSLGFLSVIMLHRDERTMLLPWYFLTVLCGTIAVGLHALRRSHDRMATRDSMTGFLNRHGLGEFLELGARAGRTVLPRAVVVVDLDGLKTVNDSLGHAAGDALILGFADAANRVARQDDVRVRLGGDEFSFILMKADEDGARAFLARLRAETDVDWSAGIADWPVDAAFYDALTLADRAMYEDKRSRKSA